MSVTADACILTQLLRINCRQAVAHHSMHFQTADITNPWGPVSYRSSLHESSRKWRTYEIRLRFLRWILYSYGKLLLGARTALRLLLVTYPFSEATDSTRLVVKVLEECPYGRGLGGYMRGSCVFGMGLAICLRRGDWEIGA